MKQINLLEHLISHRNSKAYTHLQPYNYANPQLILPSKPKTIFFFLNPHESFIVFNLRSPH